MKKKGLIISTIVMVVVLIASLTTATYAWFSTSSVTSIQGFDVQVASTNDVNIGFKTGSYGIVTENLTTANFVSGKVTYGNSTDGSVSGYWSAAQGGGINGLSNSLTPDVNWGSQTKAVAAYKGSVSTVAEQLATADYVDLAPALNGTDGENTITLNSINAANLDEKIAAGTTLKNVTAAKANKNGENVGDYVYMLLGVQPTKTLDLNTLVIMLDLTDSQLSTVGIVGSIHLAYRTSANGATPTAWTEVDIMGSATYATQKSDVHTNVVDGAAGSPAYATAYKLTYGVDSVPDNSYATFITGLTLDKTHIDQIEMILYMDGADGDCINAGLGASCSIKLFFCTANVA